ncbi:hypothetical protein A3Q56_01444 [Intoshia linei]|uniref:Uncharacterized protein n=1 Tax=Intoshia linei TaxID=1819745 RepID=A0A177B919_9BILA|nr:hypothetical protein A3Q56_01444 [Intoshia linei]
MSHDFQCVPKMSHWIRDDYSELEHLSSAYKIMQTGDWPKVKWPKLRSLSNDQWNSRAIKALQAWILGIRQTGLEECCTFIADTFVHCWLNATVYENIASYQ